VVERRWTSAQAAVIEPLDRVSPDGPAHEGNEPGSRDGRQARVLRSRRQDAGERDGRGAGRTLAGGQTTSARRRRGAIRSFFFSISRGYVGAGTCGYSVAIGSWGKKCTAWTPSRIAHAQDGNRDGFFPGSIGSAKDEAIPPIWCASPLFFLSSAGSTGLEERSDLAAAVCRGITHKVRLRTAVILGKVSMKNQTDRSISRRPQSNLRSPTATKTI
jgi:hypothetical protein